MTTVSNYQYGIRFNGHRSNEFGVDVGVSKVIGFPPKNKVTVTPVGANGVLDLTAAYRPSFGERTITVPFIIVDHALWTKESMYVQWTKVVNWLMSPQGKIPLWDDLMSEWHYLAEVQDAPSFDEAATTGTFTVVFQCYPFRIRDKPEFDDVWDDFNFDLDVAMETHLDGASRTRTTLVNLGVADVAITVVANGTGSLIIGDNTISLVNGTNSSTELVLEPGENSVTLVGGSELSADISWYSEVI